MTTIKSLEDLKRAREEALNKKTAKATSGVAQIIVGMGTCGIAAGARDAMKSILDTIESDSLNGVIVSQTGCIGLCEKEPIVQVIIGEEPKVTYGKVTPEIAARIVRDHVAKHTIVQDHVIPM
ncbi:MAG: (2Fe-2S) ferredoxin domain-containing protein [Anaerolineaceae bacterium]|jgi:NADP-reducing hydrogenase subunit HndB